MPEFNPQKTEKLIISLRLEENKIKRIDKLSAERDISRNEFLVQCIDFALSYIIDEGDKSKKTK